MNIEIITKQDLDNLKRELLEELKQVLRSNQTAPSKEWLKGSEVCQALGISKGMLVSLRVRKLLNPSKLQGTYFYSWTEIQALLSAGASK